jgi:hypothetical protein
MGQTAAEETDRAEPERAVRKDDPEARREEQTASEQQNARGEEEHKSEALRSVTLAEPAAEARFDKKLDPEQRRDRKPGEPEDASQARIAEKEQKAESENRARERQKREERQNREEEREDRQEARRKAERDKEAREASKPKSGADKQRTDADKQRTDADQSEPEERAAAADGKDSGSFTIDSAPWATVYVDGRKKGVTPLVRLKLSAGPHSVRLVSSAGGKEKTFRITIKPSDELRKLVKW